VSGATGKPGGHSAGPDHAQQQSGVKGYAGEEFAARYLLRHGLTLLERNYRCRFGEIDLIMRDARTLVFVEVRLRRNADFGGAAASITTGKQAKLIKAAQHYLAHSGKDQLCRFDAVLLSGVDANAAIEWIKDAFNAG
jgi:putative endonuclease